MRGFATMIAPSASLSGSSRTGSAAARYERLLPGGVNSKVTGPFSSLHRRRHRRLLQPLQAGVLAGEERGADVEDPVARRELELGGGEVDRARALVGRAQGGIGVELRESPEASRWSSWTDWLRVYVWKSRSEISAATTPASTIPSRNKAGRRNRSDPSTIEV